MICIWAKREYIEAMDRRIFIAALCAAPLVSFGSPASAGNAVVDTVNTYLTNLISAQARFRQESSDGTVLNGTFYLQKPGKMRFEYDPPSPALIIADGSALAVFDRKSTRGPQRYPQNSTPLSLLSRNNIDVTKTKYVRRIEVRGGRIYVIMFDPDEPNIGTMTLVFTENPMELVEWVITERSGAESRVKLGALTKNISIDSHLFNITYNVRALENDS